MNFPEAAYRLPTTGIHVRLKLLALARPEFPSLSPFCPSNTR